MIVNVANGVYSFECNPLVTYPSQPGHAQLPQNMEHEKKANTQMTDNKSHLQNGEKEQLRQLLKPKLPSFFWRIQVRT